MTAGGRGRAIFGRKVTFAAEISTAKSRGDIPAFDEAILLGDAVETDDRDKSPSTSQDSPTVKRPAYDHLLDQWSVPEPSGGDDEDLGRFLYELDQMKDCSFGGQRRQ